MQTNCTGCLHFLPSPPPPPPTPPVETTGNTFHGALPQITSLLGCSPQKGGRWIIGASLSLWKGGQWKRSFKRGCRGPALQLQFFTRQEGLSPWQNTLQHSNLLILVEAGALTCSHCREKQCSRHNISQQRIALLGYLFSSSRCTFALSKLVFAITTLRCICINTKSCISWGAA